jgi:phosphoribosyl-ATP pyrophosphohydrolase
MAEPTGPESGSGAGSGSASQRDEQLIRERVRDLTAQMMTTGRLDSEGVKEIVRTMGGGAAFQPAVDSPEARAAFAEAVRGLDETLQQSARATHDALQALAARGKDFGDNDLKEAFASLQKLQEDYVAVANRVADAATGNLRRELVDLALHAQRVGADASVRVAQVMSEFANRMSGSYREKAATGLDAARDYGVRMTMLTSGLLAGFADALRQQSDAKKAK